MTGNLVGKCIKLLASLLFLLQVNCGTILAEDADKFSWGYSSSSAAELSKPSGKKLLAVSTTSSGTGKPDGDSEMQDAAFIRSKLEALKEKRSRLADQIEALKKQRAERAESKKQAESEAAEIDRISEDVDMGDNAGENAGWGSGLSRLITSALSGGSASTTPGSGTGTGVSSAVSSSSSSSTVSSAGVKDVPSLFRKPAPPYCMGASKPWDPFTPPSSSSSSSSSTSGPSATGPAYLASTVGIPRLPEIPSLPSLPQESVQSSAESEGEILLPSEIEAGEAVTRRRLLQQRRGGEVLGFGPGVGNNSSGGSGSVQRSSSRQAPGRSLLAVRRSAAGGPLARPLATRCAAAAKTRKSIRPFEVGLATCLRREDTYCPADKEEVLKAAANLASMAYLKPRMKCLTVHSDGCGSIANNPETQPLRSKVNVKPPAMPRELPRQFHTCALVGNGPGVRAVQNGAVIDSHDAVFRFNAMRREADAPFTGVKSTFRIFNRKRLATLGRNQFAAIGGEHWLFWNYMGIPLLGRMRALNPNIRVFSPEVIRYTMNGYFALKRDMIRLGMGKFGCPQNVNSGIHAIFLALQMCEHVNLFGFSYSMHMLNERPDSISPRMSRFHDWAFDTLMLRMLHYGGKINMCSS